LPDERLDTWLAELVETPGLTAIRDPAKGRRLHIDAVLPAAELLEAGPVVDVGSGGGSPGLPLAAVRPDLRFTLLEATRRKCEFLERWAAMFDNVTVVCARAEEHARNAGRDAYGTAVARALAPPAVAAEWCLPLVRAGGVAILFVGPSAEETAVVRAADFLKATLEESPPGIFVLRKTAPTPERFPRRPGLARKRPLA
jgi:16S rRNA (guanine527-N7)-methyltransferase